MTNQPVTARRIRQLIGQWGEESVWIKEKTIVDLTAPGALRAVEDAQKASLRSFLARHGLGEVGIHIEHMDDVEVINRKTGQVLLRDYLTVTCAHDGLSVPVTFGWEPETGTGFDLNGDGI